MEELFDFILDILEFFAEIDEGSSNNPKKIYKKNSKKVIKYLKKHWNDKFTTEEINKIILKDLSKDEVEILLDNLRLEGKVYRVYDNKSMYGSNVFWRYPG